MHLNCLQDELGQLGCSLKLYLRRMSREPNTTWSGTSNLAHDGVLVKEVCRATLPDFSGNKSAKTRWKWKI
jgi:hypothetical protein